MSIQSQDRVLVEVAQATRALADAEADLAKARASAAAARRAFELIRASPAAASPGSLVWSLTAGAGAAVDIGTPVAEGVDGNVILDVPIVDVEAALLRKGMLADVGPGE
jgi:hypothetical protein